MNWKTKNSQTGVLGRHAAKNRTFGSEKVTPEEEISEGRFQ